MSSPLLDRPRSIQVPDETWMLKQTLRKFIDQEVDPVWDEVEETDELPVELVEKAKRIGLFGITIPGEYEGLGLDTLGKCLLEEEFGRSSYGFATLIGNHTGISSAGLVELGTPEQKARYLPRMATGDLLGAFALTEPGAGSDAGSISMTATRCEGGWSLTGEKVFVTNASVAGLFTVMARTATGSGTRGISAFLVERDTAGVEVGRPERKMGMRGAHTCPVHFSACVVSEDQLLGPLGHGFSAALRVLTKGRVGLGARCVGMASRAFDLALQYSRDRWQFGRRIADNQGLQWMLADKHTRIRAARRLVLDAALALDGGEHATLEAASAKLFATETLDEVVDFAVQVHGGLGYMSEVLVERLYRDARITRIYEGTSEIQRNIVARALLDE